MISDNQTLLNRAEALLADKDAVGAQAALEEIESDCLTGCDLGRYHLAKAELAIETGDYSANHIHRATEYFRHGHDTHSFAKARYLDGYRLALRGDHLQAREALLEAYVHYLRCEEMVPAARALNRLSYVEFQQGSLNGAIRNLRKSIDLYCQEVPRQLWAVLSMNLAYTHWVAGNFRDAARTYQDIADIVDDFDAKNRAIYHFMRPVPVALKGDTAKALELIEQARPLVQPFPREKAIFFENLGLIYLLDNQLDQAKHALEQGMEISLKIAPESTLVSQIGRLQADVALAGNDHASARTHLERALTVAEQVGERLEIAACWRVQAELSAHDGDHARATDLYRRAIDLLKQIGARYELAVTQYRAAVSGLFAQGERLALLHLAREYFESENVTPYLERIDTELSRTPQSPGAMPASNQAPVVVASSKAMKKTVTLAAHIAQSDMTVLLTGETGTGKDLLARYIHHCSGRTGDFVAVNTAAVPNEMVEAELFGFTRGAFTGAERDRVGLVQQAHEGTLYLNEIADATAEFQAKLLEVLESKAVRRLGENEPRNVNVRIIAATNRDLHQWLSEGRFRLDLYHRLNEVPIHLPPLRDRSEDIRPLTQAFLEHEGVNGQLDEDALTRLEQLLAVSAWPGNVRQLQAELRRLWMTANGDIERLITLVAESADRRERANLITLLDMADWNRREVARRLGVSEAAIRKRMARYEIAQEVVGS